MSKFEFKKFESLYSYAEEGQDIPLLMAFAKIEGTTIRMLHNYIKCRDFLGDLILSAHLKKDLGSIYSFPAKAAKEEDRPHLDETVMVLKMEKSLEESFFKNLPVINSIEEKYGLTPSFVEKLTDEGNLGVFLVRSDALWVQNTLYISVYSYLLRIMCRNVDLTAIEKSELPLDEMVTQVSKQKGKDAGYSKNVVDAGVSLDKLIRNRDTILEIKVGNTSIPYEKANLSTIHYKSGLQSFANDYKMISKGEKGQSLTASWVSAYHNNLNESHGEEATG